MIEKKKWSCFGKMPGWKTHIVFGIIFLIIVFFVNQYLNILSLPKLSWVWLLYIPIILFFAMLPDIDHRMAMPRLIVTLLSLGVLIYFLIVRNWFFSIVIGIFLFLLNVITFFPGWHHRGHTHSLLFIFILSLLIIFIPPFPNWSLAVICFIMALSHNIADGEFKFW